MHCALYTAGTCRSCQWLEKPYPQQLADKQHHLQSLLAGRDVAQWLQPVAGELSAFRNKAKMVVSGSVERPLLGMLHRDGMPVDLSDCPLYPAGFAPMFAVLKSFIARAGLTPYNVARKRGELEVPAADRKHARRRRDAALRAAFGNQAQLRAALPWLQQQLPQLKVISANIQPVHMAIMEGEREIALTEQQALEERFNQVPLFIRPQSFFQTNPQVAADLYATARDWVRALGIDSMWDLFCGVGGFGLHCAQPQTRLTGIEISAEAIACARQSAQRLGLLHVDFQALDSTRFATAEGQVPQLVLVNPPRRGIGRALCDYLSRMAPEYILYSAATPRYGERYRDVAGVPHRTGAAVRHVPAYRALRGADAVGADFIKHKARITAMPFT